ncbi:MAG: VWA domain-containing protein [Methanobacteriaceae archaeon]|nr:VWA domain-containing protein [Candidatus Methanorudis spinitermitis]
MKKNPFPFTAIVGQEKIKKALILNAVNPSIGGVLIKGDRGTGKTTAVRALANLLPEIEVVENCAFNCDETTYKEFELYKFNHKLATDNVSVVKKPMKVIELPLGATEDRLVGSLDIEKALHDGIKALEPGILAQANRNILYIDEINLLDDNLVDVLLDAAAYGVNIVEREGVSISHPSKFILVGTMNPEEGELRGQLSDRIGLKIGVESIFDIEDRILIMKRREEFEKDPILFNEQFKEEEKLLQNRIIEARKILNNVEIDDDLIEIIGRITLNLGSEGHRSDISILKTAKTIAAFNNHLHVDYDDLEEAISLVLGELTQCDVPNQVQQIRNEITEEEEEEQDNQEEEEEQGNGEDRQEENSQDYLEENNQNNLNQEEDQNSDLDSNYSNENEINNGGDGNPDFDEDEDYGENGQEDQGFNFDDNNENEDENHLQADSTESDNSENDLGVNYLENIHERKLDEFESDSLEKDIKKMLVMEGREKEKVYGSRVESKSEKGKYVKSKFPHSASRDIAIDATLRAAALHSNKKQRGGSQFNDLKMDIQTGDLREKIRKHKAKASMAIVVDMSGSMISKRKINKIRGILTKIIQNINKNKDKLAVIGFKGQGSELIIPNTKRPSSFFNKLDTISVGGTTPMAAGLEKALDILKTEKKQGEFIPMLIVLSDGMPNVGLKDSYIKNTSGNPINDVLAIGKELGENKIYTIIIDFDKKYKHGRNINMELAFLANGRYYDLEEVYNPDLAMDKILTYERKLL